MVRLVYPNQTHSQIHRKLFFAYSDMALVLNSFTIHFESCTFRYPQLIVLNASYLIERPFGEDYNSLCSSFIVHPYHNLVHKPNILNILPRERHNSLMHTSITLRIKEVYMESAFRLTVFLWNWWKFYFWKFGYDLIICCDDIPRRRRTAFLKKSKTF